MTDVTPSQIPKTLLELFDKTNLNKSINFINSQEDIHTLTYGQLKDKSLHQLGFLQNSGVKRKDPLLIILPQPIDFVPVFWASVFGGFIPVPIAISNNESGAKKLSHLIEELDNPWIISDEKFIQGIETKKGAFGTLSIDEKKLIVFDSQTEHPKGEIAENIDSEDIAYLQYSSGSTSNPKGIIIKHSNVLYNLDGFSKGLRSSHNDIIYSWLPLSHDMGLLGGHFLPIASSCDQHLMAPSLFVRHPIFWMEHAANIKATLLFSPNFGFKYFLQNYDPERHTFNRLDNIRLLLNGAEPIDASLCERFVSKLAPFGLNKDSMFCGYGMAEASLVVAIREPETPLLSLNIDRDSIKIGDKFEITESSNGSRFVGHGKAILHQEIRICDLDDNELPKGYVGQIQIKGKNVTAGYYNNPEATEKTILPNGWLKTGDIGAFSDIGLLILGRQKEMIIINGQNYFPHDLEQLVEKQIPALTGNIVLTSHVVDESEELIIFVKWRKKSDRSTLENKIKQALSESCGIIASDIVYIQTIPKTTSGKIQRHKLVSQHISKTKDVSPTQNSSDKNHLFKQALTHCFGQKEFDFDTSLMEQGCSSMQISQLADKLSDLLKTTVTAIDLFDHNTPNSFINYISEEESIKETNEAAIKKSKFEPIAVIGASCYFPGGAKNLSEFHDFLMSSEDVIQPIPSDRWDKEFYYVEGNPEKGKMYTNQGYFMDDPEILDASFFGLSEDEAKSLDPQQRLLLKASWNVIENAGITKKEISGTQTGVYIGLSNVDYMQAHMRSGSAYNIDQYSLTGVLNSTAAGRISYFLNLHGPAITTDTACSSSLVSLHLACNAIKNGECKQALAGGVNLIFTPEGNIALSQVKALSKDGRCKTFDEKADGYGRSEGVGMVILKSLDEAIKDGDSILGVIRGSVINQDGRSNGLTAPNSLAQQRLIESALESGQINPNDVSYVEAHGTGTPLGDPIELQALEKAYNKNRNKEKPLILGSVKSNIGHTESAAGVAGFLKILGAFKKNEIPKNLHFQNPNPLIPWSDLNVSIANKHISLNQENAPVLAGLSSFGLSGTNAHLIVSSPPKLEKSATEKATKTYHTICISAHRKDALKGEINQLLDYTKKNTIDPLDLSYTWNTKRSTFEYRTSFGFETIEDLQEQLINFKEDDIQLKSDQKLAILFSGQGSQYSGMGKELFEDSLVFRMSILRCESILQEELPIKLTELLFNPEHKDLLNQTQYTQVAICSLSYSLYQLLDSYGISANVVCGHSIGEYVAACISGVMKLEDMLHIVARRGKLMQSLPLNTGMISVMLNRQEAESIVRSSGIELDVAVVNSDTQTVFAGLKDNITKIAKVFDQKDIFNIPLRVSHAFHSRVMDPILDEFNDFISSKLLNNGTIPVYRNKKGTVASNDSLKSAKSWANHIRETVDFNACIDTMIKDGITTFVELGPSSTLIGIANAKNDFNGRTFSALKKGKSSFASFQDLLGNLFSLGFDVNWKSEHRIYGGDFIELPNRVWIEKTYWIPPVHPDQNTNGVQNNEQPVDALYHLEDHQKREEDHSKIDAKKPILVINNNTIEIPKTLESYQFETLTVSELTEKETLESEIQLCIPLSSTSNNNPESWKDVLIYHLPILNCLATQNSNISVFLIAPEGSNDIDFSVFAMYRNLSKECDHITIHAINSKKQDSVWKKVLPKKKRYTNHQGVHVITGGFGAIGKELCKYLLKNGASDIYIPDRSKLSEDRANWIKNMNDVFDGKITTIPCDISNKENVQSFFKAIKNNHNAINGVFHLAGILHDEFAGKLTSEHLEKVVSAKLFGAFWLHEFSQELNPKNFVLFSSASAYFANPGQTLYASANASLNSLVHLREQEELPVKLIAWGPWSEDGMASELVESFEELGIKPFDKKSGFQILEQVISAEQNTLLALDIIPEKVSENFMTDSYAPVANLNLEKKKANQKRFNVEGLSTKEIKERLLIEMNKIGKEILKLDEHTPLSNSKSYFEVGFNSLNLNQYRNRLNVLLGDEIIAVSILFKHTSIQKLADFIIERAFTEQENTQIKVPIEEIQTPDDEELVNEIKSLSDTDIEKLMNQYYDS